jgi:hypothetical protein
MLRKQARADVWAVQVLHRALDLRDSYGLQRAATARE